MPSVKRTVGLAALAVLRSCGAFRLARRLTGRGLRVLCYHGFSLADEHDFRPAMWIRGDTFDRRLAHLRAAGYAVLPLGEALERMEQGTLPPNAVVVTIDDGFHGTLPVALPALQRHGVAATLYLTTYYVMQRDPVFDVAVGYLLFRTTRDELDLSALCVGDAARVVPWARLSPDEREALVAAIVRHGHTRLSRAGRAQLLARLADVAGVPLAPILEGRLFDLLTEDEVRALHAGGVTVELHTHRHATPVSAEEAARELEENRAHIERLTGQEPRHFCYPSGRYEEWDPAWLDAADILSATTTVPGFDYAHTPRYQLSRFNDGEAVPQIMFEAEMAGVLELWRALRARVASRAVTVPPPAADALRVTPGQRAARERAARGAIASR